MVQMYDSEQFDSRTMTKWEKRGDHTKTWLDATTSFEEVVNNTKTYKDNSGNTTACHGLSSVNNASEITSSVTATLERVIDKAR